MTSSDGVDSPRPEQPIETILAKLRRQTSDGGIAGGGDSISPSQSPFHPLRSQQQQQHPPRGGSQSDTPRAASFPLGPIGSMTQQGPDPLAGYRQAMVSSPIQSPQPTGPQPRHASAVISPIGATPTTASPGPRAAPPSSDRQSQLLNLLKFAQPTSTPPGPAASEAPASSQPESNVERPVEETRPSAQDEPRPLGPSMTASELVASLLGNHLAKPATPEARPAGSSMERAQSSTPRMTTEPSSSAADANAQDLLQKLRNQTKPSREENDAPERSTQSPRAVPDAVESLSRALAGASMNEKTTDSASKDAQQTAPERERATDSFGDARTNRQTTPSAQQSRPKDPQPIFSFVSPLGPGSRNRSTRPGSSGGGNITPTYNILKRPGSSTPDRVGPDGHKRKSKESSPDPGHVATRRKITTAPDEGRTSTRSSSRQSASVNGRGRVELPAELAPPEKSAESVAEAVDEVGAQVSRQVEEALAKADKAAKVGVEAEIEAEPEEEEDDDAGATGDDLLEEAEQNIRDARTEVAPELEDENKETAAKAPTRITNGGTSPQPVPGAVRDKDQAGKEDGGEDWESEDGEDSPTKDDEPVVRVYNFPMKPFISLTVDPIKRISLSMNPERILDIARLKKDFDPSDRALVTASKEWIIYAMVKHGGFRIIRQDDGRDKQVFGNSEDRIVNVACSMGPSGSVGTDGAAVFGTGASSTVYWVDMSGADEQSWSKEDLESSGLVFPPMATPDEGSASGQIETRVRKSSRHPRFFALGRGKAIYVVWPSVAQNPRYLQNRTERLVDTDKYLRERCRKIGMGKSGRDFAFSEDDTTIISLDRSGRIKVWDIRRLVDEPKDGIGAPVVSKTAPVELRTPMTSFVASVPDERSAPCSVMFVDKHRPYLKGTAQRYLLLGMKQNHILQLWDFSLGRPVQELRFPCDEDSDATCSLAFHPASGIIVVGHPTRNSIYLLTLSAPRYTMPGMSQATYFERIAQRDPMLCKPDSTAIIVGLREYSLGSKGQLRSLDILPQPAAVTQDGENPALFELYVMHSKGVSCISVKAEDLGWNKDGRILHPVDAVDEGLVQVDNLQHRPTPSADTSAAGGDDDAGTSKAAASGAKEIVRKPAPGAPRTSELTTPKSSVFPTPPGQAEPKAETRSLISNGANEVPTGVAADKAEKRKKKRAGRDDSSIATPRSVATTSAQAQRSRAEAPGSSRDDGPRAGLLPANQVMGSPTKSQASAVADVSSINVGVSGDFLDKEVRRIEKAVSTEFNRVISTEFGKLYRRFSEDQRIQQAAGDAKLDAVLRLVSSTLTENVEKSLARIVMQSVHQSVVPTIKDVTATTLERTFSEVLREQMRQLLPNELTKAIPDAVRKAMQNAETLRAMSELVTDRVSARLEPEVTAVVANSLSPMLKDITAVIAPTLVNVEGVVTQQIDRLEARAQSDSQKIENLQELVHGLTRTVSRMATVQTEFQQEILKLQRQSRDDIESVETRAPSSGVAVPHGKGQSSRATSSKSQARGQANAGSSRHGVQSPSTSADPERSRPVEESDLEATVALMREGNYEAAFIKWLQSSRQDEIFRQVFVRAGPMCMRSLSPLVLLSVTATVGSVLETDITERLTWLEYCLALMDPRNKDIRDHVPRIMSVVIERLEKIYIQAATDRIHDVHDPALERILSLTKQARQMQGIAMGGSGS